MGSCLCLVSCSLHFLADNHFSLSRIKKHVILFSDAAGEIVQIGVSVIDWKISDRVCPNFSPDYIEGDVASANFDGSLGGPVDGVLTEYRAFPAHVCYTWSVLNS